MRYEITGAPMPVVEIELQPGESILCEGGAMSWMSPNVKMETSGGGLGKMFTKALSGENMFHNRYTAVGTTGTIAFASSFPGNIMAVGIRPGQDVICQKSAYLASSEGVTMSIYLQKKLGSGLFGGEGFIMQRFSGNGVLFLELDGSVVTKDLGPGEEVIVDTGHLAVMDATCSIDIQMVKGVKNVLLGGEGLFNTRVKGPGTVLLQTMPVSKLAGVIGSFIPSKHD